MKRVQDRGGAVSLGMGGPEGGSRGWGAQTESRIGNKR